MKHALQSDRIVDARARGARSTMAVYPHLPFVPVSASGCEIVADNGQHIPDLYGGHAAAALGYSHPRLTEAIESQCRKLSLQSNSVALQIRAAATRSLLPRRLR